MHWSVPGAVGGLPCTAQLASEDMHRGRWNFHLLPWGRNTRFINNIWNRTCKKGCYESLLSQLPRDLFCWVEALVLKLSTEHGSQFLQTNTKWFNLWLKAWGIDCLLWRCIFFYPRTCSGRAKTETIMTQERRSVETSGWDGGPRAGVMPDTSEEVLGKLGSSL